MDRMTATKIGVSFVAGLMLGAAGLAFGGVNLGQDVPHSVNAASAGVQHSARAATRASMTPGASRVASLTTGPKVQRATQARAAAHKSTAVQRRTAERCALRAGVSDRDCPQAAADPVHRECRNESSARRCGSGACCR